MKTTNLEYTDILALLPSIDFFLDKIKKNELIYFLRVNHGFVDAFFYAYPDYEVLEDDLRNKRYEIIADKLRSSYLVKGLGATGWYGNSPKYAEYASILIKFLVENKSISNKLDIGISLGVGLNTHWGVWPKTKPKQVARSKFAETLRKVTGHTYFYSGVLKHYTITREIYRMFELLNTLDYDVIFLGPKYFQKHKEALNIKNFHFVEIPLQNSIDITEEFIDKVKEIKSDKPAILFTQCGPVISAKIIQELMQTEISVIDVGRSFDLLIKEEFAKGGAAEKCWTVLNESKLNEYVYNLRNASMSKGIYKITDEFEEKLADYTGAKYAVAVDNMSNALFLALYYEHHVMNRTEEVITIPARTYPSVPCEIIHAGLKVNFQPVPGNTIKGAYQLKGSNVWDSALRFTEGMYIPSSHMCISFTGPYKHFKLSKGGAILTDDYEAYNWFRRARYSGRREMSYHDDHFDMLGWNFYMMPELAARGLLLMNQFYNPDGTKKINEDLELPYPDLSKFEIYQK